MNADRPTDVTIRAVEASDREVILQLIEPYVARRILLERRVSDVSPSYEETGNVLLNRLFGASIDYRPSGLDMNAEAMAAAEALAAEGRKPYFVPGGGSNPVGALGYVEVAVELYRQMDTMGLVFGENQWVCL